ncbi:MAG: hypothetical protein OK422_04415 [Thaumarchaeota archaeon]|nr:hypothetical protein [Nitrososphaerota archaeon]
MKQAKKEKAKTLKIPKVKVVPSTKVHSLTFPDQRIYLESVKLDGQPAFLHKDGLTGRLDFMKEFVYDGITYAPAEPLGYLPCEFDSKKDEVNKPIKLDVVTKLILNEWKTFVACDDTWRILNTAYTVLTYLVSKSMTTPYLAYFGDTETGKGQRKTLHRQMSYRANAGVLATAANIFIYSENVKGTLIQDEFESVERDRDLQALFKEGYKQGASVMRIRTNRDGVPIQHDYQVFSCKIVVSNYAIRNKAVLERFIVELTTKEKPKKDEFDRSSDLKRFAEIRKQLMTWRLQTIWNSLPDLDISFTGRAKELYKPLLQAVHGTSLYEPLLEFLTTLEAKAIEEAKSSLTALVTKACVKLREKQCPTEELRTVLADYMNGTIVMKSDVPYGIRSSEYGTITDMQIVNEIKLNLGGKKARPYVHTSEVLPTSGEVRQVRGWDTDATRLLNMVKKYHLEGDADIGEELKELEYSVAVNQEAVKGFG